MLFWETLSPEYDIRLHVHYNYKINIGDPSREGASTPINYIDYTGMCHCSGYVFQTIQSRTGCINQGNFCLEQSTKFCNIYKLFKTGCNNFF